MVTLARVNSEARPEGQHDLSIVIPVINSGKTIGKALESLLGQEYEKKNLEVLFVYYPSVDNTLALINGFAAEQTHRFWDVKILQREDKRANVARNIGIKSSSGRYLCLLNDDIVLPSNALADAMDLFRMDKASDIVTFPYLMQPARIFEMAMFSRFLGKVRRTKVFALGCSVVRRDVFERVGLLNENLGPPLSSNDDYEISARVARAAYRVVIDGRVVVTDIGSLKSSN